MKRCALLGVLLFACGQCLAAVNVPIDDFENLAANPWGYADGMKVEAVAGAHGGKAAAKITIRQSGEALGLIRPYDVPAGMTTMKLWVQGAPGTPLKLQPVFKDPQGWCFFGPEMSVDQSGWTEVSADITPAKLKSDWRMGWWKSNAPKGDTTTKYEMTFPLRFMGFRVQGPKEAKPAVITIDDLSIVAAGETGTYVHLPNSVVQVPQKGPFSIVVVSGGQPVTGQMTVKLVSRNDVPLTDAPAQVAVQAPANGAKQFVTPLKLDKPGIYKIQITGPGITDKLEKQVQAVSAVTGAAAFASLDRKAKPFTAQIANSPKQTHTKPWLDDAGKPMVMYVSELSPAWLLRNNATERFSIFTGLQQWGLGAPAFLAIPTAKGAKVYRNGDAIASADLQTMDRSWVLAWFTGSEGFTDWDTPYLIVLQHKPTSLTLNKDGLNVGFAGKAGYLAVMPLYGGYKPPQSGNTQFVDAGLAPKDVLPANWAQGLPKNVVDRCDWWAKVLKAYPVNCDEQFSVDSTTDELIVKSSFEYLNIKDDWNTPAIKLAPIPYVLGNCVWGKTFPVTFDAKVTDPMYPTCYGPYMGIENADGYTYKMHVLQYIHEVPDLHAPANPSPVAAAAMKQLTTYVSDSSLSPTGLIHHKEPNICWSIWTDQRWQSSNLLYIDNPGVKLAAQITRQEFFGNQLFYRQQYDEADVGVNRKFLFFSAPGFGFQGDAGKITMDTYYTAWLYAYATGDYQLIADRWDEIISRLNCLPFTMTWARVGRDAIAEGGDEGPPPMGMARLAYAIGDMDSYAYACYMFARELTHHYVKVGVGADYFRAFQPINPLVNMDWADKDKWPKAGPIPSRANVTNMWGETAGWILGGPPEADRLYDPKIWDAMAQGRDKKRRELADVLPWGYYGSGQWVQQWSRFDAEDIFRFYQDNSLEACRRQLDTWQKVEFPGLPGTRYSNFGGNIDASGRADGYPATPWRLMQLRVDLLGETDAQIAKLYPPENWTPADQTFYQGMVRSALPKKTLRLVAKGPATPFQPGIQRDFVGNPSWDQPVQTPAGVMPEKGKKDQAGKFNWPTPTQYYARPPKVPGGSTGIADRWAFGYITPGTAAAKPKNVTQEVCNWVMDVYTFEP